MLAAKVHRPQVNKQHRATTQLIVKKHRKQKPLTKKNQKLHKRVV